MYLFFIFCKLKKEYEMYRYYIDFGKIKSIDGEMQDIYNIF